MPKQQKQLQNYLVLNRYLVSLLGFHDMDGVRSFLKNVQEGLDMHNKYHFTTALQSIPVSPDVSQEIDVADAKIQKHVAHISSKRNKPIILKYFQYLAILLTELYLERYLNHFERFYKDICDFVDALNPRQDASEKNPYPSVDAQTMRKLAFWSATGSGKTLIMHVNYLQVIDRKQLRAQNVLLITPNEGLSKQHMNELDESDIDNERYDARGTIDEHGHKDLIKVIEITKIRKEVESQDGESIPVAQFGGNNIVFVDEGHKGHSSVAQAWKSLRKDLVSDGGFTFEYSATFAEITENDAIFEEYASSIIFDYRYKYFYEDGFGKEFFITNLKNADDYNDEYFTGALLHLYEQITYHGNHEEAIRPFNIEKPLMIFVGSTVSGRKKDSKTNSDVLKVVRFLARFVHERDHFHTIVDAILRGKSKLEGRNGRSLFDGKYPYLHELIQGHKLKATETYRDMLTKMFRVKGSDTMQLIALENAEGEVGLRFDGEFFGVINIGDTDEFLKLMKSVTDAPYIHVAPKSPFKRSLFQEIEEPCSPINFLIGSRKFIEGWNSYRVSEMCLLNIGKSEGTLIIQLFGRGVRLRGYKDYMKRSTALQVEGRIPADVVIPSGIEILETLNIYGWNATYMGIFKEKLKEEGIEEYEKVTFPVKSNVPEKRLYMPVMDEARVPFDEYMPSLDMHAKLPPVRLDLRPRVYVLSSRRELGQDDPSPGARDLTIDDDLLDLVDFEKVYLELLKYKDLKGYSNIYFTRGDLVQIMKTRNYAILCKKELLGISGTDAVDKLEAITGYVVQILRATFDRTYRHFKFTWYRDNSRLEFLSTDSTGLIPSEITVSINKGDEDVVADHENFIQELEQFKKDNFGGEGVLFNKTKTFSYDGVAHLEFIASSWLLVKPLVCKVRTRGITSFLRLNPAPLDDGEGAFLKEFEQYLATNARALRLDGIYLLRNPSNFGIGLFGTEHFRPSFILWTLKGGAQSISFIDARGITLNGGDDERRLLHRKIKELEAKLEQRHGYKVILHVFICRHTERGDLAGDDRKEKLSGESLLFLEDGKECIKQLFSGM